MSDDLSVLAEINAQIGHAEARGDRAYFEDLLAPAFAMVRPDGLRFDDRAAFLDALAPGPDRHTRVEQITVLENRASVVCVVAKGDGPDAPTHQNIRILTRPSPGQRWQLVAWLTQPWQAPAR